MNTLIPQVIGYFDVMNATEAHRLLLDLEGTIASSMIKKHAYRDCGHELRPETEASYIEYLGGKQ